MKNLIVIFAFFLSIIYVKAQNFGRDEGLVLVYQKENPKEYTENILKHANDKWGETNYDMVNLEVKHQIVSQFKILERIILVGGLYNAPGDKVTMSSEMKIIKSLIVKWSYPGWAESNRDKVSKDKFDYDNFKDVHCDWVMVLNEYDAILVIGNSKMD